MKDFFLFSVLTALALIAAFTLAVTHPLAGLIIGAAGWLAVFAILLLRRAQ